MDDRRRQPRATCRLRCQILSGDQRINARIVDISESGLCLFSPSWLASRSPVEIAINVPGYADSVVQASIWHVRRQSVKGTSRKIWVMGVMLEESDDAYRWLLSAAGAAPEQEAAARAPTPPSVEEALRSEPVTAPTPEELAIDAAEAQVFRVRVKARGVPRTKLLTLTAISEDEARELATRDLEGRWQVVEIRAA